MKYAPRFDVSRAGATELIESIHELVKPTKYCWYFEEGKETKKAHIHGYLEIPVTPWKNEKAKQRLFRKLMESKGLYKDNCYSFPKRRSDGYLGYISKCDSRLKCNITEEEIEEGRKAHSRNKADKKKTLFPQLVEFVASEEICVNTIYKCQKAVITFYRSKMNSLPNSKSLLNFMANRIYEKFNDPSDEDILETCFNICPDKKEKSKDEISQLNLLLDKLKDRQKSLEYDIEIEEKLRLYDQKEIDNLL